MTYTKKRTPDGKLVWKLYDDANPIKIYKTWPQILEQILDAGQLPTILLYEKVQSHNT